VKLVLFFRIKNCGSNRFKKRASLVEEKHINEKKLLITGAAGFLGSHFGESLY